MATPQSRPEVSTSSSTLPFGLAWTRVAGACPPQETNMAPPATANASVLPDAAYLDGDDVEETENDIYADMPPPMEWDNDQDMTHDAEPVHKTPSSHVVTTEPPPQDMSDSECDSEAEVGLSDDDDDDDDDDGDACDGSRPLNAAGPRPPLPRIECSQLRHGSLTIHKIHPFRSVPVDHKIYESMCLVVPDADLVSIGHGGGGGIHSVPTFGDVVGRTWGKFANTASASATKRLLFLWFRAIEMAMRTPSGSVADFKLPNVPGDSGDGADDSSAAGRIQSMVRIDPRDGHIIRPPGIAGAVDPPPTHPQDGSSDGRLPVERLSDIEWMFCGSTAQPPPEMAHFSDIHNHESTLVRCLPTQMEELFIFEPVVVSNAVEERGVGTVLRRVSVVLEELVASGGGDTMAWRWWFMSHDPRIMLAEWYDLAIQENDRLHRIRERHLERANQRVRRTKAPTVEPFAPPDRAECYRSIRSMSTYADTVAQYWRTRKTRRSNGHVAPDIQLPPCPRIDHMSVIAMVGPVGRAGSAAVSTSGILTPHSPMHPARVFSPSVAMRLHCEGVCFAQVSLESYVNRATGQLGAFPREMWAMYYNAAHMAPMETHSTPVASSVEARRGLVEELRLNAIARGELRSVPKDVSEALAMHDLATAFSRMNDHMASAKLSRTGMAKKLEEELSEIVSDLDVHSRMVQESDQFGGASRRIAEFTAQDGDAAAESARQAALHAGEDVESADRAAERARSDGMSGFSPEAWVRDNRGVVPDAGVTEAMLISLMASEEDHSLNRELVMRSPLLQMRMVNSYNYKLIDMGFERMGMIGSQAHRMAVDAYRRNAMDEFWNTLIKHMVEDEGKPQSVCMLSEGLRGGLKFLLGLRPNRIRRHRDAIYYASSARARNLTAAAANSSASRRGASSSFASFAAAFSLVNATRTNVAGGGGPRLGSAEARDLDARFGIRGTSQQASGGGGGGSRDPSVEEDDDCSNLWFEAGIVGARSLSLYGNLRLWYFLGMIHAFRSRTEAHLVLWRLILAMGIAFQYYWGVRPHQLLAGGGGVGKSYLFMIMMRIAFPGFVQRLDHITRNAAAIGTDVLDQLQIMEEVPDILLGFDKVGKEDEGNGQTKASMSENMVRTSQCKVDKETGFRYEQIFQSRHMNLKMGATNRQKLDIRKPIMQRWQMDHVSAGDKEHSVPLASIGNVMAAEHSDPRSARFCHQMAVINVMVMLIEKMIEARVTPVDVNTDVCTVHFPWFFASIREQCRAPEVSKRQQDMLRLLVRQATIRYAIHINFFSELAAGRRVRRRSDARPDEAGPEAYVGAAFRPDMLLDVLKHLYATEEIMADVLTATWSTYTPATSWDTVDAVSRMVAKGGVNYRKVWTAVTQQQPPHDSHAPASQSEGGGGGAQGIDVVLAEKSSSSNVDDGADLEYPDERAVAEIRARAGMTLGVGSGSGGGGGIGRRLTDDANYCAIEGQNLLQVCSMISDDSGGKLDPTVIEGVIRRLARDVRISHPDRNRPTRDPKTNSMIEDPEATHRAGGKTRYRCDETIKSPVVIIEQAPNAFGASGFGGSTSHHRVQVCFLLEYIENKAKVDVVDIIQKGLSYSGAKERVIITSGVIQRANSVLEYGQLHPANVVREYLSPRLIKPDPTKRHSRVNYFTQLDDTDAFFDNQSLNLETGQNTGFAQPEDEEMDPDRQIQLFVEGDLDGKVARRYWEAAGIEYDERNLPEVQHRAVIEMIDSEPRVDALGIPLSNNVRNEYPKDFMAAQDRAAARLNVIRQAHRRADEAYKARLEAAQSKVLRAGVLGSRDCDDDDEEAECDEESRGIGTDYDGGDDDDASQSRLDFQDRRNYGDEGEDSCSMFDMWYRGARSSGRRKRRLPRSVMVTPQNQCPPPIRESYGTASSPPLPQQQPRKKRIRMSLDESCSKGLGDSGGGDDVDETTTTSSSSSSSSQPPACDDDDMDHADDSLSMWDIGFEQSRHVAQSRPVPFDPELDDAGASEEAAHEPYENYRMWVRRTLESDPGHGFPDLRWSDPKARAYDVEREIVNQERARANLPPLLTARGVPTGHTKQK